MKQIKKLIADQVALAKDVAAFNKLKEKAGEDLLASATPSLSVADARKKILDARLTIDLANAKLAAVQPQWASIEQELLSRVKRAVNLWNRLLVLLRKQEEDLICTNSLPQFNHDETACRRWWNEGRMSEQPVFIKFREAYFDETVFRYRNGLRAADHAENFFKHVERHTKRVPVKSFQDANFSID